MATFGQSLPQRHCLYDSEEEEDEHVQDAFYFSPNKSQSCKLLIVCTSHITVAFVKSHVILKPQPLTTILCQCPVRFLKGRYFHEEREEEEQEEEERVGEVYEVKDNDSVYVALLLNTFKDDYCNEWSRKLLDFSCPEKVVILHSLLSHQYFFSDEERDEKDIQFLRSLQTRSWSDDPLATLLGCSNILAGEPAAVLSHCNMSSVPGSLVILYTSPDLTEKEQVIGLRPLLSNPIFVQSLSLLPFEVANQMIRSVLPKPRSDMDTLYT